MNESLIDVDQDDFLSKMRARNVDKHACALSQYDLQVHFWNQIMRYNDYTCLCVLQPCVL